MSKTRPFVIGVPRPSGSVDLVLQRTDGPTELLGATSRKIAPRLNEAVEVLEAKLRGPFTDLLRAAEAFSKSMETWHAGAGPEPYSAEHDELIRVLAHVRSENVGAYVPAAELAAANAKVKQLQAAIESLETERYASGALVAEFLEANGLKRPERAAALLIPGIEELRRQRAETRPRPGTGPRPLFRWEGEQAAFAQVLALLGEKHHPCKVCGDQDAHGGRPHSDGPTELEMRQQQEQELRQRQQAVVNAHITRAIMLSGLPNTTGTNELAMNIMRSGLNGGATAIPSPEFIAAEMLVAMEARKRRR